MHPALLDIDELLAVKYDEEIWYFYFFSPSAKKKEYISPE